MSGGGGGGGDRDRDNGAQESPPPLAAYGNAPQAMTFQPTLPGFGNMIAQQLAQGFGSGGGGFEQMLASMYSPMSVYRFSEPISTTAQRFDKDKHMPFNTGNAALDLLLAGKSLDGKDKDEDDDD